MRTIAVLALLVGFAGCTPGGGADDTQERNAAAKQEKSFADKLQGIQRSSEGGFGRGADATR